MSQSLHLTLTNRERRVIMYYTKINRDACIACGLCQLHAPTLYEYDENGIAFTINDNNKGTTPLSKEEMADFRKAYTHCPTGAILRSDHPFSEESSLS